VEKYGTARQATDDNIIRRMSFACWVTKATDTRSEYVILIDFPKQQLLRETHLNVTLHVECVSWLSTIDIFVEVIWDLAPSNCSLKCGACQISTKTEILGKKPVPVSSRMPQIPFEVFDTKYKPSHSEADDELSQLWQALTPHTFNTAAPRIEEAGIAQWI
jgi:hypothetical protein